MGLPPAPADTLGRGRGRVVVPNLKPKPPAATARLTESHNLSYAEVRRDSQSAKVVFQSDQSKQYDGHRTIRPLEHV